MNGPEIEFSTMENLQTYNKELLKLFTEYLNKKGRMSHDEVFRVSSFVQINNAESLIDDFLKHISLKS